MEIIKPLVFFCLLSTFVTQAFSAEKTDEIAQDNMKQTESKSEIVKANDVLIPAGNIDYYQTDNITNEIPYFDNRFRIDAELDGITLIFFRKRGSTPIILVQPDGKKIRVNDHNREEVKWHDDTTFDMIKINKPMPGPWQAVGDIVPKSKILVVSDVTIAVDPLPDVVLSGETLKVTGKLYNGNKLIEEAGFKNVAQLDVNFFSTNNSAYENFGRDAFKLASFEDNGRDLDEYAGDNIYTGEFVLDFSTGEWQPVYVIKLPLITRELRQKPILLYKSPISMSIETSDSDSMPHKLLITIDPTYVDPTSLVFQGKTTFPDRQTSPFSIIEDESAINSIGNSTSNSASRTKDIPYTEPGIHRVNLSAFGKTITGREFRLVVPEFIFNVKGDLNKVIQLNLDENGETQKVNMETPEQMMAAKKAKIAQEIAEQQKVDDEERTQTILMIAAGNGIIIVVACVLFFVLRKRKIKNKSS